MRLHHLIGRCCLTLVVLSAGLPLRTQLSAQSIGGYERGRGRDMLRIVRQHLDKYYYDPTFHGIDLRAAAAQADSHIQVAQSNGQIFRIIAQFVQALDDSHTRFYPPRRTADIKYGWEIQMIGDSCYVVRVDPKSDAEAKGLRVGDRVIALGPYHPSRRYFSPLLHALYTISPTPLVTFDVEAPDGARRTLDIQSKVTERPRVIDLLTYIRELELAEREPFAEGTTNGKDVLILRLGWFGDRSDMDRVMARARKVGTLILDLRHNPGGLEQGLVRLVGHVFDRRVIIDTVHRRRETRTIESKPVGHPFTGALFVLIDSRSASSSELFARLVQLEGRGVVLGDRSAGAVMRSRAFDLVTGTSALTVYGMSITDADIIMRDGMRLEGRGVQPDSLLLPTAADLAAGRDPVLAKALTMAGYPTDAAQAGTLLPRRGEDR
jgi:carboxyl-terminal processing protease